jgi:sporulation protein YlmC with PRC-barrel domain
MNRWLITGFSFVATITFVEAADTNTTLSEILAERPLANVVKASDLIGHDVRDSSDKKLGDIKDVALDLEGGKILYAVVSIGGDQDAENHLLAVPAKLLAAKDSHLILKADKSKLSSAPTFSAKSSLSAEFLSDLNRRFPPEGSQDSGAITNASKRVQLAKSILEMRVLDSAGEAAGEVKDLALDWNSERIPFVIVAPSGVLKLAAIWYPVPSSALKMTNGKSLALTMTSDRFVAAPQLRPGDWANLSDLQRAKQIYAFYGTPGYFESGALQSTGRTNALERIYHEPQK